MLLALDLNSTRSGWAFGGPSDSVPRSGVWQLPGGGDLQRCCGGLYNSISTLCKLVHPKFVIIEAPLQMGGRSAHTALVLMMLYGAATAAGHNAGARVEPVAVSTWRKHFIGHGNMKGDEAKDLAMQRCKMFRWPVENHDQAEALGIWDYGVSKYCKRAGALSTPLFGRRAA